MSQDAMSLVNQAGAAFRAALNLQTAAIVSLSSGPTAPPTTYSWQLWEDTTSGMLKQRNGANSNWITIGPAADLGIQSGAQTLGTTGGTANAITAAFSPAIATAINGAKLRVRTTAAITITTPTFKPDTGAIGTIVKGNNLALSLADVPSGYLMELHWDATYAAYVLDNPATGVAAASGIVMGALVVTVSGTFKDTPTLPVNTRRVVVLPNGVSTNGTNLHLLQLCTSAGAVTSGYASVATTNGADTPATTGIVINYRSDPANATKGAIVLYLQDSATNTWTWEGVTTGTGGVAGGASSLSGSVTLPGVLDHIRLTPSSGPDTFDGGSWNYLTEG